MTQSKTFTITKTIEDIAKEAIKIMTKRHYSKYSCSSLFNDLKQYSQDDIVKALTLLTAEGFIKLDQSLGKHVSLWAFQLLDNGKPIKNTMINDAINSDTYGAIYYSPEKEITCYDHLEESLAQSRLIANQECVKCFESESQCICIKHNQSLTFCEQCRQEAKLNKSLADTLGHDEFTRQKLADHNKRYWGI